MLLDLSLRKQQGSRGRASPTLPAKRSFQMRFLSKLSFVIMAVGLVQADVRTPIPPDPGDPAYSYLGRNQDGWAFFANNGVWVAFWFIRDPNFIPADFNLLDTTDFSPAFPGGPPRPFLCPNTVKGFAIWRNG